MKIGLLTTSYPRNDDDAAGHFVRGHADWLAAHVGDVDVLTCRDTPLGGLPRALTLRTAASISARLLVAARRRSWDAVVAHWLVPCGAVALTLDVPRVAIAHGSDVALLRSMPLGETFVRQLSQRAFLVYVDESLRVAGAEGIVQPMPPQPALPAEREASRRTLGVTGFVALFVGRLVEDKGCDLLLDALPPDVTLLIAGEGPQQLADHPAVRAGRARLLGYQGPTHKAALFAAADVLVVPSRRDGAPTVIGEAHAARLPVLGTSVGGIARLIGSGGWVVPPLRDALRDRLTQLRVGPQQNVTFPPTRTWADAGPKIWPFPVGDSGKITVQRY